MIRQACPREADILTEISFAAKGYWNYPQEYFDIWREELTITPEYINNNDVFVVDIHDKVVGYYSIVNLKKDITIGDSGAVVHKGFWLEHMFLLPEYIGKGFGTIMFNHLRNTCDKMTLDSIGILADPNASGFYDKMGCQYIGQLPSTIPGRTTPEYVLRLEK